VFFTEGSSHNYRFSTTTAGFVYSDQYIQLTTELASDNVYGLGEHNHRQFRHDMNWKKWTIFTRDVAPVVGPPNTINLSNYSNISGYVKLIRLFDYYRAWKRS